MERGSISNTLTSFKSYHNTKAEQAKILADNLRTDVLQPLRETLKNHVTESKKMFTDVRRQDMIMRSILERLNQSKSKFMKLCKDLEENTQVKESLEAAENNDAFADERKLKLTARIAVLDSEKTECEKQLKGSVEEFNGFKDGFTAQCNRLKEYFKELDRERLNGVKDSVLKSIVYEVSFIRNLQYDVDKVIPKIEEVNFDKDISEVPMYAPKQPIPTMNFDDFIELMKKNMRTVKNSSQIIFEKNEIVEDLGLGTAWRSLKDFFATKEDKKKEDEKAKITLDCVVKQISEGQGFNDKDEQIACRLFSDQKYQKYYLAILFSNVALTNETSVGTLNVLKRQLTQFLDECNKSQDLVMANDLFQEIRRAGRNHSKQMSSPDAENKYYSLEFYFKTHSVTKSAKFWELYVVDCVNEDYSTQKGKILAEGSPSKREDDNKRYSLLNLMLKYLSEILSHTGNREVANIVFQNASRNYNLNEEEFNYLGGELDKLKFIPAKDAMNVDYWMRTLEMKVNEIPVVKKEKEGGMIFSKSTSKSFDKAGGDKVGVNKENVN